MRSRFKQRGSAAPLALLFTLVSMSFTVAYLKNSFSQSAMEKYRYSEWKALYAAEAGLNDIGVVYLPYITSDTLILPEGVNYGKDENDRPIGTYKDIACSTKLIPNSTRKEYIAYSTGVAEYLTPSGTNVSIERRVYTTMIPQGFEEFMYFTDEEEPIGPGNTGVVNFGSGDRLEGKVHTNGVITLSNYCNPEPTFLGEVNITQEVIDQYGNAVNWGGCPDDIFEDDEGNSVLDTVSQIVFPPDNSAQIAKANATRTFDADQKLFRPGSKDTLIMTEINFDDGGYYATQWWYNIPPIGNPGAEFSFTWVSPESYPATSLALTEPTSARFAIPGVFEAGSGYDAQWLVVSENDLNGVAVDNSIFENGHQVTVENADGSVLAAFTVVNALGFGGTVAISFSDLVVTNPPNGPPADFGFTPGETITVTNIDAPTGLDETVEWNNMRYYHNHYGNDFEYCKAGDIQHFDFDYWTAGGSSCDIFSCPQAIYDSDYVFMGRTFFPRGNTPQVIYIKGGQVLVRGVVDGNYTIVTDDYTEYRRHDDPDVIDRVWGNIWLIDDIVYADSYPSGEVVHPQNGGSSNVLGLIAGGSVIVANTKPNGARGRQYGSHIKINAAILAMNGGFLSHYWQNTLANYHNWNDGLQYGVIADGRGGHRNNYRQASQDGVYDDDDDIRGTIYLWGSVVQFQRGYIKRNYPGPYNVSPGVGYDKDYHYDWNLRLKPPPYFPDLQNSNNTVILKMASYGEARKQFQD